MSSIYRLGRVVGAAGWITAVALGLAGCSFSFSTGSLMVEKAKVEETIRSQGADSATCPADLKGEVGATLTCTVVDDAETFDVTATVTSVQGTTVNFDTARVGGPAPPPSSAAGPSDPPDTPDQMTVDPASGQVSGEEVATQVVIALRNAGGELDNAACYPLDAVVGATATCDVIIGEETQVDVITVTVTEVSPDGTVLFDIADTPA